MSTSHHGDAEQAAIKRMLDQIQGTARREYPHGRMGGDDDGELAYAIAVDRHTNTIIIRFGKPVEWIGFGPDDVARLIEKLAGAVRELSDGAKPVHIPYG